MLLLLLRLVADVDDESLRHSVADVVVKTSLTTGHHADNDDNDNDDDDDDDASFKRSRAAGAAGLPVA